MLVPFPPPRASLPVLCCTEAQRRLSRGSHRCRGVNRIQHQAVGEALPSRDSQDRPKYNRPQMGSLMSRTREHLPVARDKPPNLTQGADGSLTQGLSVRPCVYPATSSCAEMTRRNIPSCVPFLWGHTYATALVQLRCLTGVRNGFSRNNCWASPGAAGLVVSIPSVLCTDTVLGKKTLKAGKSQHWLLGHHAQPTGSPFWGDISGSRGNAGAPALPCCLSKPETQPQPPGFTFQIRGS